jgi:uncharacterized protein YxeA
MKDLLITVVKPIVISIATHEVVKKMVIDLLENYVRTTDNSIDDVVVALVKEKLFKPQV